MLRLKSRTIQKFLILLLAAGAVAAAIFNRANIAVEEILEAVERIGLWAPLLYILLYVLTSGILIPSIIIKVFAGTLFGVGWGIMLASVAATISSSIKFLLARYLFRESIVKKIQKSGRLEAIDRVIETDGWKMLMVLRNVPVVNSMFINYICGVTKMKLRDFVAASFIGRLPTTVMYVYLGYIVRYTYKAGAEAISARHLIVEKIALFIGLAATAGASFYLIYLSRKKWKQALLKRE